MTPRFGGVGNDKISDWVGDDFVDAGDGIDTLTYEDYAKRRSPRHDRPRNLGRAGYRLGQ